MLSDIDLHVCVGVTTLCNVCCDRVVESRALAVKPQSNNTKKAQSQTGKQPEDLAAFADTRRKCFLSFFQLFEEGEHDIYKRVKQSFFP